jgi:aldehyde:ferredoxin oxidoreductase
MYGLNGRVLRIDLGDRRISEEGLSEEDVKKYLGGRGLADKYLYQEVEPGTDALSPQNKLIFFTGLLTGTISPSASRYSVVSKSPLTGIWA